MPLELEGSEVVPELLFFKSFSESHNDEKEENRGHTVSLFYADMKRYCRVNFSND